MNAARQPERSEVWNTGSRLIKPDAAVDEPGSSRWLHDLVQRNRRNEPVGLYSVCSANSWVIEAAMCQAIEDHSMVCIESTCNQVNQFGGYTGLTPSQFAGFVRSIAARVDFPEHRILFGGDHLGPYPWRGEPAQPALEKAAGLVRASVLAGYTKIHLDASMACADDSPPLADELIADRAAALCQIAEKELPASSPKPLYVIGTEVPTPGGETGPGLPPAVTPVEHVRTTLENCRSAFLKRGLGAAWERVIGLVVQPGVEFGDASVFVPLAGI